MSNLATSPSGRADRRSHGRFHRILAALALLMIVLTGCGSGFSGAVEEGRAPDVAVPSVGQGESGGDSAAGGGGSASDGGVVGPGGEVVPPSTDTVIVTGNASVRTDDPGAAAAAFILMVNGLGGHVSVSEISPVGDRPTAFVTVRIPSDEFQGLVDRLPELGEVITQSSQSEDVGQEMTDIEARIDALQASIDRLTQLMEEARTTTALLEAEAMITQRQAELDSLRAQLTWLEDRVAMSTLTVYFATVDVEPTPQPIGVWERAWRFFVNSAEGILYFVMGALPWIALVGVVVAAYWFGSRGWRRRRAVARGVPRPAGVAVPAGVGGYVAQGEYPQAAPSSGGPATADLPTAGAPGAVSAADQPTAGTPGTATSADPPPSGGVPAEESAESDDAGPEGPPR